MHTFPLKTLSNPKVDYQEADDSCSIWEQALLTLNFPLADLKRSILIYLLLNSIEYVIGECRL